MADVVLDASALLALINQETGAEVVERAFPGPRMSAVNYCEVVLKLSEQGFSSSEILPILARTPVQVVPFDEDHAFRSGTLDRTLRKRGISFGDRACLSLGHALGLPIMTSDKHWAQLQLGVELVIIR